MPEITQQERALKSILRLQERAQKAAGIHEMKLAIVEFITGQDGFTKESSCLLGDEDMLKLAAEFPIRRGKKMFAGHILLDAFFEEVYGRQEND